MNSANNSTISIKNSSPETLWSFYSKLVFISNNIRPYSHISSCIVDISWHVPHPLGSISKNWSACRWIKSCNRGSCWSSWLSRKKCSYDWTDTRTFFQKITISRGITKSSKNISRRTISVGNIFKVEGEFSTIRFPRRSCWCCKNTSNT